MLEVEIEPVHPFTCGARRPVPAEGSDHGHAYVAVGSAETTREHCADVVGLVIQPLEPANGIASLCSLPGGLASMPVEVDEHCDRRLLLLNLVHLSERVFAHRLV